MILKPINRQICVAAQIVWLFDFGSVGSVAELSWTLDHVVEAPSPTAADVTPRHDTVIRQVLRDDGGGPRFSALDPGRVGARSAGRGGGGASAVPAEADGARAALHVDADGGRAHGRGDMPGEDRESKEGHRGSGPRVRETLCRL